MEDVNKGLNGLDLQAIFGNDRPVEVDIGCGKGRFLVQESLARPGINFIGVDRMARKLGRALRRIERLRIKNVRIYRCDVFHFIEQFLPPSTVTAFYVFFPDPWPKKKHHRRRFFSRTMIKAMSRVLVPGGKLWTSTDHFGYFVEIMSLFEQIEDFEEMEEYRPPTDSQSDFEEGFNKDRTPFYCAGFQKK